MPRGSPLGLSLVRLEAALSNAAEAIAEHRKVFDSLEAGDESPTIHVKTRFSADSVGALPSLKEGEPSDGDTVHGWNSLSPDQEVPQTKAKKRKESAVYRRYQTGVSRASTMDNQQTRLSFFMHKGPTCSNSVYSTDDSARYVAPTLPMGWPGSIRPRGGEFHPDQEVPELERGLSVWHELPEDGLDRASDEGGGQLQLLDARAPLHALRDPSSWFNIVAETLGLVVLVFDLTTVPFCLAWDVEITGALEVLSMISLIYWTLDLVCSFLRGYYKDGELIMDFRQVAFRYLRTWFFPDCCIVVSEWVSFILSRVTAEQSRGADGLDILRFVRLSRLLRLLGALRIMRLMRILEGVMERSITESHRVVLRVVSLSWVVLWVNHMLCCAWYAIGRSAPSSTGFHWIDFTWDIGRDGEGFSYRQARVYYQYFTALHWAMAQTALGAVEISSVNTIERIFNIFCLLCGLLFGSTLVSTLSATMVEVQMRGRTRSHKMQTLRRYLVENLVDRRIALQVQRQVVERLGMRDRLISKDVQVLQIISPSLRQELHAEICSPFLLQYALFRALSNTDEEWFKKFCSVAVDTRFVRLHDEVFLAGTEGQGAYHLNSGKVEYIQDPKTSGVPELVVTQVQSDSMLAEAVLWSEWIHVGTAVAASPCSLLAISPRGFWDALESHNIIRYIAYEYRACYHTRIANAVPPLSDWPTDVFVPLTDYAEVVWSMSQKVQRHIGALSLRTLRPRALNSISVKNVTKLKKEVQDGRSILILDGRGRCQRVVSLVLFKLRRADGRIFAQIGAVEHNVLSGPCLLPGLKRQRMELASEALQRLISTKLTPLMDRTVLMGVENQVETMFSKAYGVPTKYLRKVCHAELNGNLEAPMCTYDLGHGEVKASPTLGSSSISPLAHVSTGGSEDSIENRRYPVFVLEDGLKRGLYAWLQPEEFERLSSPGGEKELRRWLSVLHLPPDDERSGSIVVKALTSDHESPRDFQCSAQLKAKAALLSPPASPPLSPASLEQEPSPGDGAGLEVGRVSVDYPSLRGTYAEGRGPGSGDPSSDEMVTDHSV